MMIFCFSASTMQRQHNLEPVALEGTPSATLKGWLSGRPWLSYDFIFLAGNAGMVVEIRHYLRNCCVSGGTIKAQGFWR